MRFEFEDVTYDVVYEHDKGRPRRTTCYIARGEGPVVAYVALCKHPESFSYHLGREIARGRALKRLFSGAENHKRRRAFDVAYRLGIAHMQVKQRRSAERKLYEVLKGKYGVELVREEGNG